MTHGLIAAAGGLLAASAASLLGARRKKMYLRNMAMTQRLIQHWVTVFGMKNDEIPMVITGIESSFNPNTENHNERAEPVGGAWGLMQVVLNTAKSEIEKIKAKLATLDGTVQVALSKWNGTGQSLLDPTLNTMLGVWYLAGLAKEFNNDFDLVVAAYQQGPGHIKEALARGQSKEAVLTQVIGPKGREYVDMANAMRTKLLEQRNA